MVGLRRPAAARPLGETAANPATRTFVANTLLSESEEAGVYMVMARGGREFFITGHSEYSALTLDIEYRRDKAKGLDTPDDGSTDDGEEEDGPQVQ